MNKSRKQKQLDYEQKYSNIPIDYKERLEYMCKLYNISDQKMNEIILKRTEMLYQLQYNDLFIILYQNPEGQGRPRYRIVGRTNYMIAAYENPEYIHVYSPHASEDKQYFTRLYGETLLSLEQFIQTPCIVTYNAYFQTPSYFNITDIFLAEIGLHRYIIKPDYDNIGKKYSDIYNDRVWLDDSLVVSGTVNKFYSILPRIEINLRYLNYATNKKQYDQIISRSNYRTEFPISYLDSEGKPKIKYKEGE